MINFPVEIVTEGEDVTFVVNVAIEDDEVFDGIEQFSLSLPSGAMISPLENDIGIVTVMIHDREGV